MKLVILILVSYILIEALLFTFHSYKASSLVKKTYTGKFILGNSSLPSYKVLVVGDSVGAGVGATSFETSVVGRVGNELSKSNNVRLNNLSVSGYKMNNVLDTKIPDDKYDLVLLIVSSNDLFHMTNMDRFKKDADFVLGKYSKVSKKVIIIGPGRLFDARAIPLVIKPIFRLMADRYSDELALLSKKYPNVTHVSPIKTSLSMMQYGYTGASDRFHPNDEGHRFWFDLIKPSLSTNWWFLFFVI